MSLSINTNNLNLHSSIASKYFDKDHSKYNLSINNHAIKRNGLEEGNLEKESNLNGLPTFLQELLEPNDNNRDYEALLKKIEYGEDLTDAELVYLRKKDPKLYQEVQQEIAMQKQFERRLKNCKSKKEAQSLYLQEKIHASKICGISGNSGLPRNEKKYNRLINRIEKSYVKYQKGKLKNGHEDHYDAQV